MTEARAINVGEGAAIPSRHDWGLFNAWTISIVGAVGAILYLYLFEPAPYKRIVHYVADGIIITFEVTVMSILCACCIGLVVGLGRVSKNNAINLVASTYVEIIRGIPLLVQL
ncbi:MAG: ABC transporter permease subunit, partial [Humidesulfovibrio sp.]|nr:ABC transporter permease subunit [Humidesulfovibrio sp.]